MKLAQFSKAGRNGLGWVREDGVIDLRERLPGELTTMVDLIERWKEVRPILQSLDAPKPDFQLQDVTFRAPISRPGKIMGIGLNYADHAAEAHMELPKDQLWFSKAVTAIADPFGVVHLPKVSDNLDYEAELILVIGNRCRHVSRSEAARAIFGYSIGNDVSVRDWQFKTSQFILGKSFDTHAPIGPWIVTADSIDANNLAIRCLVNGEERQSSNTRHFIFDGPAMVEHLSKVMTLEPGDIIFTGTPAGVGAVRKPPVWLKEGDHVRVEIEGIGHIENLIVREP
jgi:2-keto-4-pentenoate hydratase/2-oxohepta-3-ene-1,7-dioic acid hydratase in catechol pathway